MPEAGPTAKVRSAAAGERLVARLTGVASHFGLKPECLVTDGSQPVGRSLGPALEMIDVLAVLRGDADAPLDLRERSLRLAGALLELGGATPKAHGVAHARQCLDHGTALEKFERICRAQGGYHEPPRAPLRRHVLAKRAGTVLAIDNRRLARIAKLAGAPDSPAAGLQLHVRNGSTVECGQPLMTIHAESDGALKYALGHAERNGHGIEVEDR